MGQLQLDMLVWPALLMQDSGRHAPEAVTRHAPPVAHSIQRVQDGIVAHRLFMISLAGKQQAAAIRQRLYLFQHHQRLM
ncbi:hypothetical protein D3C72_2404250 [compost metagenome]